MEPDRPAGERQVGPGSPGTGGLGPETALPSVGARVLAFGAVLVGGACGGFIGHAFGELGGFGPLATGLLLFGGGIVGAGGVAVIAVLTLRAIGEWNSIRAAGPDAVQAARDARARRPRS